MAIGSRAWMLAMPGATIARSVRAGRSAEWPRTSLLPRLSGIQIAGKSKLLEAPRRVDLVGRRQSLQRKAPDVESAREVVQGFGRRSRQGRKSLRLVSHGCMFATTNQSALSGDRQTPPRAPPRRPTIAIASMTLRRKRGVGRAMSYQLDAFGDWCSISRPDGRATPDSTISGPTSICSARPYA